MKLSEFKSADNLTLYLKDGVPSPNIKGAKEIKIKIGESIPEVFIPRFITRNPDYIANLPIKDSIPQLTKEQEKKYKISFKPPEPITFKEVVDKVYGKYNLETLTGRLVRMGDDKFKDWCEKNFGEDKIDKRKASKNLIVQILNWQNEEKI